MFRWIVLCFAVVLASCASNKPDQAGDLAKQAAKASAASAAAATVVNPYVPGKPFEVNFDKLSIKLDTAAEARLSYVLDAAKQSKSITVRGFCDKTEVGNAKQAAIARALAVKEELVSRGVPANKFASLRYTTDEKKHAAVVDID